MSDGIFLVGMVSISLLISIIIPQIALSVTDVELEEYELTGFWGTYVDIVEYELLGVNIIPFESFRNFLLTLAVGWSFIPPSLALLLGVPLIFGMIYTFIKMLPTT